MNGADVLINSLLAEKVEVIFGYPGGSTLPLHDRLYYYPQIRHVLPRHEQGAAMAADAYFRVTGKPGVCLSTSGPGATNLVTGIANAYLDSVGMVAITCQVASSAIGTDAFQEVDITGITQSITKQSYLVEKAEDLPRIIKEAFYLAGTGRPGPVHIDVPVDILKQKISKFNYPKSVNLPGYAVPGLAKDSTVKKAIKLINKSKCPVALVGHGVIISRAETELKKFVEKTGMPVIYTLLGKGALSDYHKLNFGMLGMHGMAYANYAVHNADLLLGIGLRFDDRITGKIDQFAKDAKVIHLDIDPAEIGKNTVVDVPLFGDCKLILQQLNQQVSKKSHKEWLKRIEHWSLKMSPEKVIKVSQKDTNKLMAYDVISEINKINQGNILVTSDVGQNQMWTAQHFKCRFGGQLLSSGGLGCMGYSLPASIGAQIAKPKNQVWALMGDGGFQMNVQELATVVQEKLPIKIIVFNNGFLGMVRQWQELFYQKNYMATPLLNPDFVALAKAYGIKSFCVKNKKDLQKYFKITKDFSGPVLLEVVIGSEDNVYPMVPPGNSLNETVTNLE